MRKSWCSSARGTLRVERFLEQVDVLDARNLDRVLEAEQQAGGGTFFG